MRGYGLPRHPDLDSPDKADIKYYGLSTTDRCSKKDRGKNSSRRIWKKKERAASKQSIKREVSGTA